MAATPDTGLQGARDTKRVRPEPFGLGLLLALVVQFILTSLGAVRVITPIHDGVLFGGNFGAGISIWSVGFSILSGAILFGLGTYSLVLFLKKSRRLPPLFETFCITIFVIRLIETLLIPRYPLWYDTVPLAPEGWRDAVTALIGTLVWISYFRESERVKETFVND